MDNSEIVRSLVTKATGRRGKKNTES